MAIDGQRLRDIEKQFGGVHIVPRTINSPHDPSPNPMDRGGDRMDFQNYADTYAKVLPDEAKCIVELGILRGAGLAMWSALYPDARLIGLDLDIDRFQSHRGELKARGAFRNSDPEVRRFDELAVGDWQDLTSTLQPGSVDVWVDDANHCAEAIFFAWVMAEDYMATGGVYIIEDNDQIGEVLKHSYPDYNIITEGRLTVIQICR